MNIQNNLISDINNFYPVTYFKSNKNGFQAQKNHKSTGLFFKQNIGQNIENDAINNNNNNNLKNLQQKNNNSIIIENNIDQNTNINNIVENNEEDNREVANVTHIHLMQRDQNSQPNEDENMD